MTIFRISKPFLKQHHNLEHRPPERCSKCGQRGRGIVIRHHRTQVVEMPANRGLVEEFRVFARHIAVGPVIMGFGLYLPLAYIFTPIF